MQAHIISIVAKGTNSGKTFLMEKLIEELKSRGKRVTAIKHSTHMTELDKKGKDTYKYACKGADRVILFSDNALLLYEHREPSLEYLEALAGRDADIILLEGFKSSPFKKIEVFNPELYDTPLCSSESKGNCIAIVSKAHIEVGLPWFSFDQIGAICDFIEVHAGED